MDLAQRKADERKVKKRHKEVFTLSMQNQAKRLLKRGFSPEQIAGRCKLQGVEMVCYETIYQWIWNDKHRAGALHKYLRHQGRKYTKRGSKNAGRGFTPIGWM